MVFDVTSEVVEEQGDKFFDEKLLYDEGYSKLYSGKIDADMGNSAVTVLQRYYNPYSKSYGMNLYKDTDMFMGDITFQNMESGLLQAVIDNYEKYEKYNPEGKTYDEYHCASNIMNVLQDIVGVKVWSGIYGNSSIPYGTTHDTDNFLDNEIIFFLVTEQNESIQYDQVYIVWAKATYCNTVGVGHWNVGVLNTTYEEFVSEIQSMSIQLWYGGEYWYSDDGYTFRCNEVDNDRIDDDNTLPDVDDIALMAFETIEDLLSMDERVKITSDISGLIIMKNPQNVNDIYVRPSKDNHIDNDSKEV